MTTAHPTPAVHDRVLSLPPSRLPAYVYDLSATVSSSRWSSPVTHAGIRWAVVIRKLPLGLVQHVLAQR
ncbi:hypothetical protein SVIOM74S_04557 [Streptomyces violarus]